MWFIGRSPYKPCFSGFRNIKKLCQHVISNQQANESVQHLGGGPRKAEKTLAEFARFAG